MLLIVDMQPNFPAALCEKTQEEIIKLVKQTKKNKERIIYLEYEGAGDTLEKITVHTEDYPHVTKLTKWDDDGSNIILEYFGDIRPNELNVCGVNTGFCVKQTVVGLLKEIKGTKINLHINACNHLCSDGSKDRYFDIEQIYLEGVNVI